MMAVYRVCISVVLVAFLANNVASRKCALQRADVVIVQDSSSNIKASQLSSVKIFLKKFVHQFTIGTRFAQFAYVSFGGSPKLEFGLKDLQSEEEIQLAIDRIKIIGGSANGGKALSYAYSDVILRSVRTDTRKIVLFLIGGSSLDSFTNIQAQMRSSGVEIYAIPMNLDLSSASLGLDLLDLVGSVDKIYSAVSYDKLDGLLDSLLLKMCPELLTTPKPKPTTRAPKPTRPALDTGVTSGIMCSMLADGNYASGKCKRSYFTCVSGLLINQNCLAHLIYDPAIDACDAPSNTLECTGTPPTTIRPTSGPLPTAHPLLECSKKANGDYPHPKESCSHHYFTCSNGRTLERTCASGLFFDPELLLCGSFFNIPACSGSPRPTTPTTTRHQPLVSNPPAFDCTGKLNGQYAQKPCSSVFYMCSEGSTKEMTCPGKTFFDAQNNRCDLYDHITECTGSPIVTVTYPTVSTVFIPPVDFDCLGKSEEKFHSNPKEKCSQHFFSCVGGIARQHECQNGLVYSEIEDRCEAREIAFECTGVVYLTTESPTYPTPIPVNFDCTNLPDGHFNDPDLKCSHKFFYCAGGVAIQMVCPGGTFFDADLGQCEFSEFVVNCGGSPLPPTTPHVEKVTSAPEFDCSKKADGMYADPIIKCSTYFYSCWSGQTSKLDCPLGLFFDRENQQCDAYGNIFDCSGVHVIHTTPVLDEPQPTTAPEFDCTGKKDGQYADPSAICSSKFFTCSAGVTGKYLCPGDLYYDKNLEVCGNFLDIFDCAGKTRPPSTLHPLTTTVIVPSVSFDCTGKKNADYSEQSCSSTYFSCVAGRAYLRHCPEGTFFDGAQCDSFEYVQGCGGSQVRTPSPTYKPEISEFDCAGKKNGIYPAGDCLGYYFVCVSSFGKRLECPAGLKFDIDTHDCSYPDQMVKCGGNPIVHSTISYSTEASAYDCKKLNDGLYSAGDCVDYYFVCSGGFGHKVECPYGLKFDLEKLQCGFPIYLPKCGGSYPTTPSNDVPKPGSSNCDLRSNGLYSNGYCSSGYFKCKDHQITKLSCPIPLVFDDIKQRCAPKSSVSGCQEQ